MMQRKKLFFELGVELFLMALVITLLIVSYQPQLYLVTTGNNMGPFVFPRIILYLFGVLLIFDGIRLTAAIRHMPKSASGERINLLPKPVALTLAAVVVYALLWNVIGFTLSTILFLATETKIVNSDIPLKKGVLVAVIGTAIILVIFVYLFKMNFPEPLLDWVRGY